MWPQAKCQHVRLPAYCLETMYTHFRTSTSRKVLHARVQRRVLFLDLLRTRSPECTRFHGLLPDPLSKNVERRGVFETQSDLSLHIGLKGRMIFVFILRCAGVFWAGGFSVQLQRNYYCLITLMLRSQRKRKEGTCCLRPVNHDSKKKEEREKGVGGGDKFC